MKRVLLLILFVSLGLNVGLGLTLWTERGHDRHPPFEKRWDRERPEGGPGRDRDFGPEMLERKIRFMTKRLALDDQQRQEYRQIQEAASSAFVAQILRVREARQRLREQVQRPNSDELRVRIAEVGHEQTCLDSLVTEVMFQEMKLLNNDQRARYLELLPQSRFDGRFGGRSQGPADGRRRE